MLTSRLPPLALALDPALNLSGESKSKSTNKSKSGEPRQLFLPLLQHTAGPRLALAAPSHFRPRRPTSAFSLQPLAFQRRRRAAWWFSQMHAVAGAA